jgi:Phage-related minor tail protein
MATGSLGTLTIDLAANITRFEAALNKAERVADKRANAIKRNVTRLATGLGAALGTFGFVKAVEGALDFADAIGKAADRAGVSTQKLQELRFAADQNGVSVAQLDDGVRRFSRRLGEFINTGAGPAAAAFKAYGIEVRDSAGNLRGTEAVMDDVIRLMGTLTSQSEKSALAAKLFGDDAGPQLALALGKGIEYTDKLAARAHALGIILDDDLIRKSEETNDKLSVLSQVINVQLKSALLELSPHILTVTTALTNLLTQPAQLPDWMKTVARIAAYVSNIFGQLEIRAGSIGATISLMFMGEFAAAAQILPAMKTQIEELNKETQKFFDMLAGVKTPPPPGDSPPPPGSNGGGNGNFGGVPTDEEMKAVIARYWENNQILLDIDRQAAEERKQLETDVMNYKEQSQTNIINSTISLFRILGAKRKEWALAALAIEKGIAIAQIAINTSQAIMKSYAIYGDTPAGHAAAAHLRTLGVLQASLVAATGIAQASQINTSADSGGASAPGTFANPINTTDTTAATTPAVRGSITINVNGVITQQIMDDIIIPAIQDATDRDILLFSNSSRQAQEIYA